MFNKIETFLSGIATSLFLSNI